MSDFLDYVLPFIWLFMLLAIAAVTFSRFLKSRAVGALIKPLNADDRLRVSLALRLFEDAEKELGKAAWRDNLPGHPRVGLLLLDLHELQAKAQNLLRES